MFSKCEFFNLLGEVPELAQRIEIAMADRLSVLDADTPDPVLSRAS